MLTHTKKDYTTNVNPPPLRKGLKKQIKPMAFSRTQCIWELTLDERVNMGALRLNSCHKYVRFGTNIGSVWTSGGRVSTVTPHLQQPWVLFSETGSLIGMGIMDWAGLAVQQVPASACLHLPGSGIPCDNKQEASLHDSWDQTQDFIFMWQTFY